MLISISAVPVAIRFVAWIPMAVYLRARHPEYQMVKAKLPFIDAEQLDEAYLPPSEYHSLQRLTRQLERLMKSITVRKNRIGSIING